MFITSCSNDSGTQQRHKLKLTKAELESGEHSDELKSHLRVRAEQLKLLFSSPRIINALTYENEQADSSKGVKGYQQQDEKMQKNRQSPGVQSLLYNACAIRLKQFQAQHPAFVEIFITNLSGINVCQSNMTTDFYQADEKWWQDTYDQGIDNPRKFW